MRVVSFGSEQYVWHSDGPDSHADPAGPAAVSTVQAAADTVFTLPKASVTVLRGKIAARQLTRASTSASCRAVAMFSRCVYIGAAVYQGVHLF